MIVTHLTGGLGNQMFQYAFGRCLADRLGTDLHLDLSAYANQPATETPRKFELDVFRVRYAVAGEAPGGGTGLLDRVRTRLSGRSPKVFTARGATYDPRVEDLMDGVHLKGYWQSERYFSGCADRSRQDFVPVAPMDPEDLAIAARMTGGTSVSVHVRRGDYVSNSATAAYHPTCGPDYYERAAQLVCGRDPDARFFVFSDDIGWARAHLRFPGPVEHVHRPQRPHHFDMLLMARCKHHIIANSSFSWWGAWLNPDPAKTVIAPRRWFHDPSIDTRDLLPPTWTSL